MSASNQVFMELKPAFCTLRLAQPKRRRLVNIAPPGTDRTQTQEIVALRVSKTLLRRGTRRVDHLIANVTNALRDKASDVFVTQNYFSPQFAQPAQWIQPRNMNILAKVSFEGRPVHVKRRVISLFDCRGRASTSRTEKHFWESHND